MLNLGEFNLACTIQRFQLSGTEHDMIFPLSHALIPHSLFLNPSHPKQQQLKNTYGVKEVDKITSNIVWTSFKMLQIKSPEISSGLSSLPKKSFILKAKPPFWKKKEIFWRNMGSFSCPKGNCFIPCFFLY